LSTREAGRAAVALGAGEGAALAARSASRPKRSIGEILPAASRAQTGAAANPRAHQAT